MSSKLERITMDGWKEFGKKANNVKDLAALCNVSSRCLQKFFKKQFRMTPGQWMERERVEPAIPLLRKGFKVVMVAREMGFKDVSHFNKVIRRCFNARPTDFSPRAPR